MKTKIVVIVIVGLMLGLCQFIITKAIQPEVATNLALEQFANPSTQTDTASRMVDVVQPVVGFVWFTYVVGSLVWILPNLKCLITNVTSKEEGK